MKSLRNYIRTLRRYPVASVINLAGISLSIAAFLLIMVQVRYDNTFNSSIPDADRVFRIEELDDEATQVYLPVTSKALTEASKNLHTVEKAGFYTSPEEWYLTTGVSGNQYEHKAEISRLQYDLLEIFNFRWVEGDTVEYRNDRTIVIPRSMAERLYPDGSAVGSFVKHDEDKNPYRIIAVYEDFPKNSMLKNVIYRDWADEPWDDWGWNIVNGFVKLHSSADRDRTRQELTELIREKYGLSESEKDIFHRLTPLTEVHFTTDTYSEETEKIGRNVVRSLVWIAFFLIAIALINYVNFSTGLAPLRLRNINTRKVLGNETWKIRLQLILEGVCMMTAGFLLAMAMVKLFSLSPLSSLVSDTPDVVRHLPIFVYTFLFVVAAAAVAGLYPAFYITSFPLATALKGSAANTVSGKKVRTALLSIQYFFSFLLIITALYIRLQNEYIRNFPIGIEKENVVVVEASHRLFRNAESVIDHALLSDPRILSTAYSTDRIVSGGAHMGGGMYKGVNAVLRMHDVGGNFLETFGIRLQQGRDFTPADRSRNHPVMILNETAVRTFGFELKDKWRGNMEVTGIADDFHFETLHYRIEPMALIHLPDGYFHPNFLYIRIAGTHQAETLDYIRTTLEKMNKSRAEKIEIGFLDRDIDRLYQNENRISSLITLFSLLTITLSLMGVFGMVLFEANNRRKEIGIRKINGASVREILWMFNKTFFITSTLCFLASIPLSIYMIRLWKSGFTYQSPVHPWIFLLAYGILVGVTALTVTFQSYRTAAENPVNSLKTE